MATGNSTRISLDDTLAVFETTTPPMPLTASEVATELDCARRTAYDKLETLTERGELETKKVGARGRVWWRSVAPSGARASDSTPLVNAQFQELVDEVDDYAIFALDEEGHIASWNSGAEQIKGYDEAEIRGEHVSTFYTEEERAKGVPEHNLDRAREEGRIEDEGWRLRSDGTRFWAVVVITAIYDSNSELRGYLKVTRDMTERHAQEERLRREKERFETLVREVKDYAIFLLDSDGTVQTWNEGAQQIKGYTEDEIVGQHFSIFYPREDREDGVPERNLAKARERGRVEDEGQRLRKDGETFWANVTITALWTEEGNLRGYAKVTRDMTERHRYEERLRVQRDELQQLDQINDVIRKIDQALVAATSRSDIEEAVCENLSESDPLTAAWIGEYDPENETLSSRTWAGLDESYRQAIQADDGMAEGSLERSAGLRSLKTRAVQPVQDPHADLDTESMQEEILQAGIGSAITVPLVYNDVEYGVLAVYGSDPAAFDQRQVTVMSELGETISHAMASIRRRDREQMLTALQESTKELLRVETKEAIADVIVDTLTQSLELSDAFVYHLDTSENTLEPIGSSLEDASTGSQFAPLSAGSDSPIWTCFMDGEPKAGPDGVLPDRSDSGTTLLVPLSDYGVLAVDTPEGTQLADDTRHLVELVATTAEAAFDRLESRANLQERDDLLQEQNRRLQRLNQINTIIRAVDQGLVQASTREEIQRIVCERLTEGTRFRFAWIGVPEAADGLVPHAWSGSDRGYLDTVELDRATEPREAEPALQANEEDEVVVISNVAADLRAGEWRKAAFSREFQSAIAVPLRYEDLTYGVLAVYAETPDVFERMERSVFSELGQTIANALHAVETRHRLLSDEVVDVEFQLRDRSESFLGRVAAEAECEVEFDGAVPLTQDKVRLFFTSRTDQVEAVTDVLERSVGVEAYHAVGPATDVHSFEAVVAGHTIPSVLLEQDALLRAMRISETTVTVEASVPSGTDVRRFVERVQDRFPSTEFVARRVRERPMQSASGFRDQLESSLTDRQREVLRTAYLSGFFDSPRQATGRDIADVLDVSQPTVTEHLRTAEAKLLDIVFDDERAD